MCLPIIMLAAFMLIRFIYRINDMRGQIADQFTKLELTLANISQGISMVDGDFNLIFMNNRFYELLDVKKEDLSPGTPLKKLYQINAERGEYGPGDVRKQVSERMDHAKQIKIDQFVRVRPNGTAIEVSSNQTEGGGFVTTYTDITDQIRAENDARNARARLVDAISVMDEAFVYFDSSDRLLLCNDMYREYYPNLLIYLNRALPLKKSFAKASNVAITRYPMMLKKKHGSRNALNLTCMERMSLSNDWPTADGSRLQNGAHLKAVPLFSVWTLLH